MRFSILSLNSDRPKNLFSLHNQISQTGLAESKIISRKSWIDNFILLSILFLYAINMYFIISLDFIPPKWDEAVHLRDSFVFYNIISDPFQLNFQVIKEIINKSDQYPLIRPSGYYPPLAPILTSLLYFIFGMSATVALMSNVIFLAILIFSVYKIGTLMFDRIIGLLASLLILLFPVILQHSIIYYLDLPLTALTALSFFTILKTDYFRDTKFSVIAGVCFGLGMLTKWTFLFFILGPLCYTIVKAFTIVSVEKRSKSFFFQKSFKNIILFIILSIVIFGPYYFPILSQLLKETFKYSHGPLSHGPNSIFSFDSIVYYFLALWKEMITPFGFILFIIGLVLLSISKNKYKILLFVWIIIAYIIFTFIIQTKTPRFMMPWLVPISLIITFCINEIAAFKILNGKFKLGRYFFLLSLIVFGIFFFREDLKLKDSIITRSKENWKINEIVSVIEKDMIINKKIIQSNNKPIYLGTIPDHDYINGQTIRYYASLRNLPINVIKIQDYTNTAFDKFVHQFDRYDYILTKNISNIVLPSFQKSLDNMNNFFYSHINNFISLKTFPEPDGSEVSIFKRKL